MVVSKANLSTKLWGAPMLSEVMPNPSSLEAKDLVTEEGIHLSRLSYEMVRNYGVEC